jgi:hypothetical protein
VFFHSTFVACMSYIVTLEQEQARCGHSARLARRSGQRSAQCGAGRSILSKTDIKDSMHIRNKSMPFVQCELLLRQPHAFTLYNYGGQRTVPIQIAFFPRQTASLFDHVCPHITWLAIKLGLFATNTRRVAVNSDIHV